MVQEYYEKYTEELNEALKGLDKAEIQKLWEKMEEIRLSGGKIFGEMDGCPCDHQRGRLSQGKKKVPFKTPGICGTDSWCGR